MYKKLLTVFQKDENYTDFRTVEILFDVLFHKYLGPTVERYKLSLDDVQGVKEKIISDFVEKTHRNVLASLVFCLKGSVELVARSRSRTETRNTQVIDIMHRLEEILSGESNHNQRKNKTI